MGLIRLPAPAAMMIEAGKSDRELPMKSVYYTGRWRSGCWYDLKHHEGSVSSPVTHQTQNELDTAIIAPIATPTTSTIITCWPASPPPHDDHCHNTALAAAAAADDAASVLSQPPTSSSEPCQHHHRRVMTIVIMGFLLLLLLLLLLPAAAAAAAAAAALPNPVSA